MLSHGDDYPIHQRPEPVATSGTDRNFYDRYFFNGQSPDGSGFFAVALGVYPHLGIVDAAFSLWDGATQRSVFGSRLLTDRMDTRAGPIRVVVEEPLRRLRVTLGPNKYDIEADLTFTCRAAPIEEPRFTWKVGHRTIMDVTRLTQNGEWTGRLAGNDIRGWRGTRDRSWGTRPIGAPDAQPVVPPAPPQFFWLWAPLNFQRYLLFFHTNDHADGSPWNRSARLVELATGNVTDLGNPSFELVYKPGTRHATSAVLRAGGVRAELTVGGTFFMPGIGYGHPSRGHGMWQGPDVTAVESINLATADEATLLLNHVQALVAAILTLPDGSTDTGRGVLEQLFIGPHAPSGFTGIFDLAQ
jgi:hypothetical protein